MERERMPPGAGSGLPWSDALDKVKVRLAEQLVARG
jgi:hypothetical protein